MKRKPKVLFVVGPTASGKSELAIALAKHLNGEVISADSMLVYKGMDIGTAKLTNRQRRGIRHHGIDLIPHTKNFSVFAYRQFALKTIKDILWRGKMPIVAGGTGFYIRALLEGLSPQPGANLAIRRKLEAEIQKKGLPYFYKRLLKIDRKRALAIGPHNQRRIIRALEIYQLSGHQPSQPRQKSPGLSALGYKPVVIGLNRDRAALYDRINRRVDGMFRHGLIKEVKRLSKKKFSVTALQGVGYKEVLEYLKHTPGVCLWVGLKERIKQATRHFAKRQWTWFKREKEIRWVWWPESSPVRSMVAFIQEYFDV